MRAAVAKYPGLQFLDEDHFGKMDECDVKRLAPGTYHFGARKIFGMIINAKLVIRVGGGFVNFDEFIRMQYGSERAKAMFAEGKYMSSGLRASEGRSSRNRDSEASTPFLA